MTCSVCGKSYPCLHNRRNSAVLVDHEMVDHESLDDYARHSAVPLAATGEGVSPDSLGGYDAERWRQEVASRVQQHRARRRKRLDPNGSLSLDLDFSPPSPEVSTEPLHGEPPPLIVPRPEEVMPMAQPEAAPEMARQEMDPPWPAFDAAPPQHEQHKIIRFPRTFGQQPPRVLPHEPPRAQRPPMVMVEVEMPGPPVQEAPRIVYASEIPPPAEQMELLPSFDDIRLEPREESPREELELPPQVAPLKMRAMAGALDLGIVLATVAFLAYGFARLAGDQLPSRMAAPCLLAGCGVLWLIFQYLFLVHGQGTPGMAWADLELATFAGEPASVVARRHRALSSALSAFSVGLGYAWALVDEDELGWHDRMTGTCLKSRIQHSAVSSQLDGEELDEMDLPY